MIKKRIIKIVFVIISFVGIFSYSIGSMIHTEPWWYNSVNTYTNEITWSEFTEYDSAWNYAVNRWDEIDNNISIPKKIGAWYNADVVVEDYYKENTNKYGYWSKGTWYDHIKFNKKFMDKYSDNKKRQGAMHELGHALGLAHYKVYDNDHFYNVMYEVNYGIMSSLGAIDFASYYYLWD